MMMADPLELNSDEKNQIVKNFLNNETMQFEIISTVVTNLGDQRTGYLGDHYRLSFSILLIGVESDQNQQQQEVTLFVKMLPTRLPPLAKYLEETRAFSKEAQLFQHIIPRLTRFGRFCPEALFQKDNRMIIFRNVRIEGFRVLEHNNGLLDLVHLEQALRTLARLHAASFALESQLNQNLVTEFPGLLDENAWILEENYPRVAELEADIETLCLIVNHWEKNPQRKEALVKLLPECMREIYELVKTSESYRNVFSHGDLWNNNIMFRYSGAGRPLECLLVDFQLARYVPPAYDFNMLVTLTTTTGFRRKNYSFLQGYYYQSLRTELLRHQLEIEKHLTQDEFRTSCQRYARAAALDNFIINHVTLLPKNLLENVFSSPESYSQFSGQQKNDKILKVFDEELGYRTRIVDMIENIIDIIKLP